MTGTTSPLGFPYPSGTDRVMDGDNAMQALAEAVDDSLAGGSAVPSFNGVQDYLEGSRVYKRGRVGIFHLAVQLLVDFGPGAGVAQVPAGYGSAGLVRALVWDTFETPTWRPMVLTNQGIAYCEHALPAEHKLLGTIVYPLADTP